MTGKLTIIGDVHGKWQDYMRLIDKPENTHTVQLGDLGFNYEFLDYVNWLQHVWFPGNHDNYDDCFKWSHCLGNYGLRELNGVPFYFVRGGFSIDQKQRKQHQLITGRKIYWENEELAREAHKEILNDYCSKKPLIMITHDVPNFLAKKIGSPGILQHFGFDPQTFTTDTQQLLQKLWEAHQPKLWVHGHFHINYKLPIDETTFIGLGELGTVEVTREGEFQ